METHKRIARRLIWTLFGKNIHATDALPVLTGPLKGRLLPKRPALDQMSMLFGRYEPAVISEILRLAGTTKVAYDVGANLGYVTLALAHGMKNGGKVFAFEPVPGNVEFLKEVASLNRLEERVAIFPLALGNAQGQQQFIMWGSSAMHLLESAINGQDAARCPSMMVEGSTLDSVVFERKLPPPDLIKIDVEGAEALVLEGASRLLSAHAPIIILEIHGPASARKTWAILGNLNYRWLKLTGNNRSTVPDKEHLVSYFSKDCWTNHFLLTREPVQK